MAIWGKSKKTETENDQEVQDADEATVDTDAAQPEESKEEAKTPQPQENQPVPGMSDKWEYSPEPQSVKTFATSAVKTVLNGIRLGISPDMEIRPAGTEEWKPIKEWETFAKECNALVALQKTSEPASDSTSNEVKALVETLQAEIRSLTEAMEYTKTFTSNQKSQIDTLYEENRKFKEDIIGKFKEKLALAIVEQLDILDNKTVAYKENEISQEDFLSFCCELANDFREILQNRLDIDHLTAVPGEDWKSQEHKILRRHNTDDPSLNKKIKFAKRYGYKNEAGKIIRPALVETHEYIAPAKPAEEMNQTEQETLPDNPEHQEPETSKDVPTTDS